MHAKWKVAGIALCLVLALTACKQQPSNDGEERESQVDHTKDNENEKQGNLDVIHPSAYGNVEGLTLEPGTYISVIGRGTGTEYWDEVKAGAEQAAQDINDMMGYKGDDKVKVNYCGPSEMDDVDEQVNILDEELDRNPGAVCIAIVDANACGVQFDLATENGIPVVALDSGSDYQRIMAMCSTDNNEAAKTAAVKLSEAIGEQGKIAMIAYDSTSTTGKAREEAFVAEIRENHPNVEIARIYHMDALDEMAAEVASWKNATKAEGQPDVQAEDITQEDALEYILAMTPDLKGIYATNVDASQLAVSVCGSAEVSDDITIVGFDGGKKQIEALKNGTLDGLILQNPYGIGYASVVAASRAILDLGNQDFVNTSYVWVTRDNLEEESIQKMLY